METFTKHQLKVLMFFCPNLAKGAITHFYGLLKGFAQGKLKTLFSPQVGTPPHIMTTPPISVHKLITPIPLNLKEHLWNMALDMVDVASGNQVFPEHLMLDVRHA
jgi:hypothetical protein